MLYIYMYYMRAYSYSYSSLLTEYRGLALTLDPCVTPHTRQYTQSSL